MPRRKCYFWAEAAWDSETPENVLPKGGQKQPEKGNFLELTNAIAHAFSMKTITATQARSKIYQLMDEAADSHEPIQITGKRGNAILLFEEDWRAIQETLYLMSIPGMKESIIEGGKTPVSKCATTLGW